VRRAISLGRGYNPLVLRKFLAGFAIASLVVCLLVLIFWARSYSHIDHVGLRGVVGGRAELTTNHGTLMVTRTNHLGNMVNQESNFYPMRQVVGGCLVIPALWLAVKIRSLLPRPGGRRGLTGLAAPSERRGGNGTSRTGRNT
jgi:hypothetical protein